MRTEYQAMANLDDGIKKVFNRCFKSEGFSIVWSEGNLLIAKKGEDNNVNVEYERLISEQVKNRTDKCDSKGVIYLDLTEEFSTIMNTLERENNLQKIETKVFEPLNSAINKAIMSK